MSEFVLEVKGLKKYYKDKCAVNNLDLQVKAGEIFGIIGPNGAGKSTTIECILGTKKRDSGDVQVLGYDPKKKNKDLFQQIGVQFQDSFYPDGIKVKEVCEMIAALYKDTVDYKLLLEQFGLSDKQEQQVAKLSGGERQKLSVLLALLNKPKIIFLDELTTGLDPSARREVWQLLKTLQKKGFTILLTSHFMDEVEFLCDRVMIIHQGEIVATGTLEAIKSTYQSNNLEDIYLSIVGKEERDYEIIENAF